MLPMSSVSDERELVVWMSYLMIAAALIVVVMLKFQVAQYGRFSPPLSQFALRPRMAWLVQESPSFLIPILVWHFGSSKLNFVNMCLLGLFLIHYFQRTFIFSFLIRSNNVVHLQTFLPAIMFCCYNGFMQSKHLLITDYPDDWVFSVRYITGVLLFFGGMLANIHSDHILINLRKPGETGYKIPKGGLFEYVSGANYFGENVEWIGYAIACWSLPAFAFALFTTCNTGPRAIQYHRWYWSKFKDYPRERKALVPFLL